MDKGRVEMGCDSSRPMRIGVNGQRCWDEVKAEVDWQRDVDVDV